MITKNILFQEHIGVYGCSFIFESNDNEQIVHDKYTL